MNGSIDSYFALLRSIGVEKPQYLTADSKEMGDWMTILTVTPCTHGSG